MTPEQQIVMQRLFQGEAISYQPGGLAITEVCFHNQDSIDHDLFQSLINAKWVREIEQSGTCISYGASNLGKVSLLIEVLYFRGSTDEDVARLKEVLIAIQMRCHSEIQISEKHTLNSNESGPVLARGILDIIMPIKTKKPRKQTRNGNMKAFTQHHSTLA